MGTAVPYIHVSISMRISNYVYNYAYVAIVSSMDMLASVQAKDFHLIKPGPHLRRKRKHKHWPKRSLCASEDGRDISISIRISKYDFAYTYLAIMSSEYLVGISIRERLSANQRALYAYANSVHTEPWHNTSISKSRRLILTYGRLH